MSDTTILVFGDICPRWGNSKQFDMHSAEAVFHDLLPVLKSADYVVANLEAPLTDSCQRLMKNSVNLYTEPDDAAVLHSAGICAIALANNHILDCGVQGLLDTLENAKQEGIRTYGAGSVEEADKPCIVEFAHTSVGFLAFAEHEFNAAKDYQIGAALWDDLLSVSIIQATKDNCDTLIVQYHGGIEGYIYPSPKLQNRCRAMIDAGADIVLCQHSHCVGTREAWHSGEILYGQGNSIFGYEASNEIWNSGLLMKLELSGGKREITYIPIEAWDNGERLMPPERAKEFLRIFQERSAQIGNRDFIVSQWEQFCKSKQDAYLPLLFGWGRILNKVNRVFHGALIRIFTKKRSRMTVMNLIRCDAHREVLETIFETEFYEQ